MGVGKEIMVTKGLEVDTSYLVKTLKRMVSINSILPHEQRLAEFIADEIRQLGVAPEVHEVSPGRPNVYVSVQLGNGGRFISFSGHSDTVGAVSDWQTDPFEAVERDGRLYGLGAINMKSGLACMLAAFKSIVENRERLDVNGRVGLMIVVDQEGLSTGADAALKTEHAKCDAMLHAEHFFGDSEENYLPIAVTGKVLYKLTVHGRSAHAFRPHEGGINAITDAASIVKAMEKLELGRHHLFGEGTYCTLKIAGGPREYSAVVPELCEVVVTRLTVPGESRESAVEDMRRLIDDLGLESSVDIATPPPSYDSYQLDPSTPIVPVFKSVYEEVIGKAPYFAGHRGIVDANVFVKAGIPTIVFGPKGAYHHRAGEYVEISSLEPVARVFVETALRFLKGEA
ncbi:MAG: M20 family metallopeptidase [bacterium]|nr:M20 family metallopeptidase [bacterium]